MNLVAQITETVTVKREGEITLTMSLQEAERLSSLLDNLVENDLHNTLFGKSLKLEDLHALVRLSGLVKVSTGRAE